MDASHVSTRVGRGFSEVFRRFQRSSQRPSQMQISFSEAPIPVAPHRVAPLSSFSNLVVAAGSSQFPRKAGPLLRHKKTFFCAQEERNFLFFLWKKIGWGREGWTGRKKGRKDAQNEKGGKRKDWVQSLGASSGDHRATSRYTCHMSP